MAWLWQSRSLRKMTIYATPLGRYFFGKFENLFFT